MTYERQFFIYLENLKRRIYAQPLNLGGVSSSGGGVGGPPGGFLGLLPQSKITFDKLEAAINTIPDSGASLLDNLNRIRHNIASISGVGGAFTVQEDDVEISDVVTVLNFEGSLDVTDEGAGKVTVSGSGSTPDFTYWSPLAPPLSPSAYDDEFDDESGGVPSGWTEFDNDGELTVIEDERGLILQDTGGAYDVTGIVRNCSTWGSGDGDGYTIYVKASILKAPGDKNIDFGIFFAEDIDSNPTTCDITTFGILAGNNTYGLRVMEFTDYDSHDSTPWNPSQPAIGGAVLEYWLRVRCHTLSSTYSYHFEFSNDGITWVGGYSMTRAFAPQEFGLFIRGNDTNAEAVFSFFRVSTDNEPTDYLKGDRINGYRAT